jgi:alkyl sulfatase BDS1-like metallo-beta-lactamase superfamily hydrolase
MSVDALLLALRTTFDPAVAGDLAIEVDLRIADDRVALTVANGQMTMRRGPAHRPDATITADVASLRTLVYRGTAAPGVRIDGDKAAVQRLLAALR